MKRRDFLKSTSTMAGLALPFSGMMAALEDQEIADKFNLQEIDPYFLDSGNLSAREQTEIEDLIKFQEQVAAGKKVTFRGTKPKRAPSFRLLHWQGELGSGKFVGPLSLKPTVPRSLAYNLNAQILAFHPSSREWQGKNSQGALTIEFRARIQGEPMTWLYAEQFGVSERGASTLGHGYICQKRGMPDPVVTESPNIDVRMQLMQHRNPGLLGKILKIAAMVMGGSVGADGQATSPSLLATIFPAIRIPRLVQEGVAMSQSLIGGTGAESPIWQSGYTSYGLSEEGSRLSMNPGLWVAMDESAQQDLSHVQLVDYNGQATLVQNDKPLEDMNYLVMDVGVGEGQMSHPSCPPCPQPGEDLQKRGIPPKR
ncbi:MAG: hypothetical protein JXA73_22265 [Acidobacteria bacterium]|nr:hypothetical protein [Acidobacteriota bacterium]